MGKFFGGLIVGAIAGALGVYIYNEYQDDGHYGENDIDYSKNLGESLKNWEENIDKVEKSVETEIGAGI
ncbi:MAG: hypothetical protein LBT51_02595 [Fusobacteriaceae bacterium]|jgi:hypothetical protein|nr:hypothetical protein [Fusobacteriaceae bacterium]